MRKYIIAIISLIALNTAFASDQAQLNIRISNPVKENKYFLCLYGVGCLSIRAGNKGKTFPLIPETDIGNIQKMVVTDVTNMSMHMQPSDKSCNVVVNKNQKLTISGQLIIKNNTPYINHLHCSIV